MTTDSSEHERSSLQDCLAMQAQFDDGPRALNRIDSERMADFPSWVAQRCLVRLSDIGYLTEGPEGSYRLAGESESMSARQGEGGTLDMAA